MEKVLMKSLGAWLNLLAMIDPARTGRLGFRLFAHPRRSPVTRKHMSFFNTAEQSQMKCNGQSVQVYRWGGGPRSVLFMHGWQSHTYRWKRYIQTFRDAGYTVYAFDAPGHGQSGGNMLTVPLYAEVLNAFVGQYEQPDAVIAHSMGSFAAFYAFYRYPNITPRMLTTLAAPGEASEFLEHYRKTLSLSSRVSDILVDHFKKMFREEPSFFSAPAFARGLRIPGLIIHDELDAETSVTHSRRIHAAWSGSRLVTTKGLGHNLKSNAIVDQVYDFVKIHLVI
jgi:pimeloyl-ACP methyl ester carboxylesterase